MACDTYDISKPVIATDYEKKKESERRRKLRLLQVRQQSKDFSDKLRQTIQAEVVKKQNAAKKAKMQTIRDRKMEELKQLKDMYGACLENIGLSHREAAKQPNINLIKELEATEQSKEAAIRGHKARKQYIVEKSICHQKMNAPIEQKRETRNRENMRSFFISCLPQKTTELKKSSRTPKKVLPNKIEPEKSLEILTELPSNLNVPQAKPTCFIDTNKDIIPTGHSKNQFVDNLGNISKQSGITATSKLYENNHSDSSIRNECSCDYLVCSCHFSQPKIGRRRHCQSESSISSDHSSEAKKPKLRTRSCSPPSVRTLNYCRVGNVYESKEPNFAEVKHHPKVADVKLQEVPTPTNDNLTSNNNNKNEELQRKTEERCSKALQREQLKKDFLQLLQDLKRVNREKLVARNKSKSKTTVYQRERDILTKNEAKQKKLANAFETLLQTVKHKHNKNKGLSTDVYHSSLDSSSPPTLNLATYQQISMEHCGQPRRVVSPEEETILPTQHATCNPSPKSPERRKYGDRRLYPEEERYSRGKQYYEGGQYPESRQHTMSSVKTDERDCFRLVCYPEEVHRDKRKKPPQCNRSPESGTSYCSLPEHLTPSQQCLLDELLAQVKKKGLKPDLKLYIQRLLNMSRESIENLPTSPRIDRARSPLHVNVEESMRSVAELVNDYADRLNDLVNTFEVMENCASPLHMNLPEHIALGPPRHLPTSTTIVESKPTSPIFEHKQTGIRVPLQPVSPPMCKTPSLKTDDGSPVHVSPQYQQSPGSSQSSTSQPHSDQSPLSGLPSKLEKIQTPFGLSSNLLPNPTDLFRPLPSPEPQVQQTLSTISESPEDQMYSSLPWKSNSSPDRQGPCEPDTRFEACPEEESDSCDDSTSLAFVGLPKPPVLPPGAPPIDEDELFMKKFGHLPGEGPNQLDFSNLSAEMARLCSEIDNLRILKVADKDEDDDTEVPPEQPSNKPFQCDIGRQANWDEMRFYDEDIQDNVPQLKYLQSHLQS